VFTRPTDVDDADLMVVLDRQWGVDATHLTYLAVGFGSHHWQATAESTSWFVTVDDLRARQREPDEAPSKVRERLVAAFKTAAALGDAGYEFVVAPVRTNDGEVTCDLGDRYIIALYPLLQGRTSDYGNYADPAHRDGVVRHLAALHLAPEWCGQQALAETFSIARRSELVDSTSQLGDPWRSGPFAEPTRRLLKRHLDALERTFETYDRLAANVRVRSDRFVLTHGEPHPANTIVTDRGIVLVDWDTTLIAPPERDLWDMIGDDRSVVEYYESLTGITVDHDAVEMYRLAWDLNEIALYISDFRRPHDLTADTAEAWKNLQYFLDPNRW
jgi:aminoglycoside phosphotransferase (APT) family kinase protein